MNETSHLKTIKKKKEKEKEKERKKKKKKFEHKTGSPAKWQKCKYDF